jgi:ABC-type multidrug transport system ATPase subunit
MASRGRDGGTAMIEARGLTKRYGTVTAVQDLTFTVPAGQVTGFLGPNGAGKSTTLRLILGLDAPDSGTVTVSGRPYASYRKPPSTRSGSASAACTCPRSPRGCSASSRSPASTAAA